MTLVPPPPRPVNATLSQEWESVTRSIGWPFPTDYRQFIEAYGSGAFLDYLEVLSPFSVRGNLLAFNDTQLARYAAHIADFPETCRFPVFPFQGGLFAIGGDENGNGLFWLTAKNPDDSTIAYFSHDFSRVYQYDLTLTEFLTAWLTHSIDVPLVSEQIVIGHSPSVFFAPSKTFE
jgi:hypothetical protein